MQVFEVVIMYDQERRKSRGKCENDVPPWQQYFWM